MASADTPQDNQAAKSAKSAADKAESYASTAEQSKTAAELAASASQNAQTRSETAATASEAANARSEAAATASEAAKDRSEAAAQSSESAKNRSETAATNSEAAQPRSEAAATASEVAKSRSETAAASAETGQLRSETAASASEAAKDRSEAAATTAEADQTRSEAAADESETSKDQSVASAAESLAAKQKSETSSNEAEAANQKAARYAKLSHEQLAEATKASEKAWSEAKNAADAHNMTTTVGLAGAFNKKARSANRSQAVWASVLAVALILIGLIGAVRFGAISELVKGLLQNNQPFTALGIELLLSVMAVAAPAWLAWLSSRMISRYFHLAEDYAYKAAIAKAYMGFKEQAKDKDPIFEARLFAAAVTQLDANPLRFFESGDHPGSPLQDLFQQPFMQAALKNPTFKDDLINWTNRVFKTNFHVPDIVIQVKPKVVEEESN